MKTKRRKVWVIWDKHGPCASYHRRDLAKQRLVRMNSHLAEEERETVVPMVERLPGDVVLSREQADLICRRLNDLYDVTVQDKHEIRALLRGRR